MVVGEGVDGELTLVAGPMAPSFTCAQSHATSVCMKSRSPMGQVARMLKFAYMDSSNDSITLRTMKV